MNREIRLIKKKKIEVIWFDYFVNEPLEWSLRNERLFKFDLRKYIYMSPMVILLIIYHYRKLRRLAYHQAIIDIFKPTLLITGIHMNSDFWYLAKINKDIKFLAVQNSSQVYISSSKYIEPYFFPLRENFYTKSSGNIACFGRNDDQHFIEAGMSAEQLIPIGSIKLSFFKTYKSSRNKRNTYSLCIVADKTIREEYFTKILVNIANYQRVNGMISIIVAMKSSDKSHKYSEDCEYIKDLLGNHIVFSSRDNIYSSYEAADAAEVIIGSFSSLLIEMYSSGKKILTCNYTNIEEFDFNVGEESLISSGDQFMFNKKLKALMITNIEEYRKKNMVSMSNNNICSSKLPSHARLQNLIKEMIK